MKPSRLVIALLCALFASTCLGLTTGCNNAGEEIPLAKVPPPPDGFGNVKKSSKIPSGASPENATARRL